MNLNRSKWILRDPNCSQRIPMDPNRGQIPACIQTGPHCTAFLALPSLTSVNSQHPITGGWRRPSPWHWPTPLLWGGQHSCRWPRPPSSTGSRWSTPAPWRWWQCRRSWSRTSPLPGPAQHPLPDLSYPNQAALKSSALPLDTRLQQHLFKAVARLTS